jgi:Enolase C-terminal domain-like/Mandelate racemase / muconate lactonizing enzyme, N-terminal domain
VRITSIEIRVCDNSREAMSDSEMRSGGRSRFDFLVITIKTDEGIEGHSFGFAGRGADMAAGIAASALKPFFLGKDPLLREKHWQDFRTYDRWWNHVPIYSYGPFDICLYDIAAKKAGLPLYKVLGAYRDKVPVYASSFVLSSPEAYAKQALEVKRHGWHAYKLHPPGKLAFDLEAYRACREAVGPDFKLMADPVAAYSYEEALRVGRELERLNYYWLEEPLFDSGMYRQPRGGHRADRRFVEGRRNGGDEDGAFGGIVWGTLRIAHYDLSSAGNRQLALLRCDFELRVLRSALPVFVHGLRNENADSNRCRRLCSSAGVSGNWRGLGLEFH